MKNHQFVRHIKSIIPITFMMIFLLYNCEPGKKILRVATCQFPVCGDIDQNSKWICAFINEAADSGAEILQFPEAALTGYGAEFPEYGIETEVSFIDYYWDKLRSVTSKILELANKRNIWVILGSAHYVNQNEKPKDCLYVISPEGKIFGRYDKRNCVPEDLKAYSSGDQETIVTIKNIKCGLLICADCTEDQYYKSYSNKGVSLLFHSYYNARTNGPISNDSWVPVLNQKRALDYNMWILASNSSAKHSCWPASIFCSDSIFTKMLTRHEPGILYQDIPLKE